MEDASLMLLAVSTTTETAHLARLPSNTTLHTKAVRSPTAKRLTSQAALPVELHSPLLRTKGVSLLTVFDLTTTAVYNARLSTT